MSTPTVTTPVDPLVEAQKCVDNGCPCIKLSKSQINNYIRTFSSCREIDYSIFRNGDSLLVRIRPSDLEGNHPCNYVIAFRVSNCYFSDNAMEKIYPIPQPTEGESSNSIAIRTAKTMMDRERIYQLPQNKRMTIKIYKEINDSYATLVLQSALKPHLLPFIESTNNGKWRVTTESVGPLNFYNSPIKVPGYRQVLLTNRDTSFYQKYDEARKSSSEGTFLTMKDFYERHDYDGDDNAERDGLIIKHSTVKYSASKDLDELTLVTEYESKIRIEKEYCSKMTITMSLDEFFTNYHLLLFVFCKVGSYDNTAH